MRSQQAMLFQGITNKQASVLTTAWQRDGMPVRSASGGLAPARDQVSQVVAPSPRVTGGDLGSCRTNMTSVTAPASRIAWVAPSRAPSPAANARSSTRPGSYLRGLSSGNSNKASWCIYLCGSRPRSTPPLWRRTLKHGKASGYGCSGAVAACTKCALLHAQLCLRRFVLWAARICWKKALVLQLAQRQPAGATGALRMQLGAHLPGGHVYPVYTAHNTAR